MMDDALLAIILSVIGSLGVVSAAAAPAYFNLLAKLKVASTSAADGAADAAEAHRLAARTDHSINNRDTTLSDRLDDVKLAVGSVAKAQAEQGVQLGEQRKDILAVRAESLVTRRELGLLHGEDRALRRELSGHLNSIEPMVPMIEALHKKWNSGAGRPPES